MVIASLHVPDSLEQTFALKSKLCVFHYEIAEMIIKLSPSMTHSIMNHDSQNMKMNSALGAHAAGHFITRGEEKLSANDL